MTLYNTEGCLASVSVRLVVLAVSFGAVGFSCPSWYTTIEQHHSQVTALGVMTGGDPDFGLHAAITLSGPGGGVNSDDSGDVFGQSGVSVNVFLNIGVQDGTYTAVASYDHVPPGGGTRIFLAQENKQTPVQPFVQLVRTSRNPAGNLGRTNGETTATAHVLTSNGCAGSVSAETGMTYPSSMLISIAGLPPGGDGAEKPVTALVSYTMSGNNMRNFDYKIKTGMSNPVGGVVTASSYFTLWPSSCVTKGPDPASTFSATQALTVNP